MANGFGSRLMPGEHILWSGQPAQGLQLSPHDIYLIPFSVLWCGFAFFWEGSVIAQGGPGFFMLWGIPFVAVGLFVSVGRFFLDAWARSSIEYAVTDRRILISRARPTASFQALSLDNLPDARISGDSAGRATLYFGERGPMFASRSMGIWMPSFDATPQFFAIEGASSVFDLIQRARSKS